MSHLNNEIPNQEELFDLDSFDLAFLVITGHVHFVPQTEFMSNVVKAHPDVALWGPQAKFLGMVMRKAWQEYGNDLTRELTAAFNTEGDITVDENEIERVFSFYDGVGEAVWAEARDRAVSSLALTQKKSREFFSKQSKEVQKADGGFDEWAKRASEDHLASFTREYPERVLHPEVKRLAEVVQQDPSSRLMDKSALRNRIENISNIPPRYMDNLSDIETGRLWTYTGIQMAVAEGVTEYQVVAQHDRNVCAVCEQLDGHRFSVAQTYEKMTNYFNQALVSRPNVSYLNTEKQKKAVDSYKPSNKGKQTTADKSEVKVMRSIGKNAKHLPDREPYDVVVGKGLTGAASDWRKASHLIEVKTIIEADNDKITMHKDALWRKKWQAKFNPTAKVHTVVFDERTGKMYYKGGIKSLGSWRLYLASGELNCVEIKSLDELPGLIAMEQPPRKIKLPPRPDKVNPKDYPMRGPKK